MKLHKKYFVRLVIEEVIEQEDKLEQRGYVAGAEVGMIIRTVELVSPSGDENTKRVLHHATEELLRYVTPTVLRNARVIGP